MMETQTQLLERLQLVFREVLDNDSLKITPLTKQENIRQWDSLAQVTLVMAIEREFDVYFTAKQVADLTSVAAILSLLEEKIK